MIKGIFLEPTSEKEIMELITDLIPKNSSGYDNLSNRLLKKLFPALIDPLTIVFNKSLAEGILLGSHEKGRCSTIV